MKHLTLTELLVRQQSQTRLAQRAAGAMAILWLALTVLMITGWLVTW